MIRTMTAERALQGRSYVKSAGTGTAHWTTNFLGQRSTEVKNEPQVMLIEMSANETIISHFHAVDQFQVFVAGSGTLARHAAQPLTLQYADHHTGYGPIIAGPQGLSYFVLRAKTDSGTVYLDRPGYREKLRPSKKRNRLSRPVTLSTEPVLLTRGAAVTGAAARREGLHGRHRGIHAADGPRARRDRARQQGHRRPVLSGRERQSGMRRKALPRVVHDLRRSRGSAARNTLRHERAEAMIMNFPPG